MTLFYYFIHTIFLILYLSKKKLYHFFICKICLLCTEYPINYTTSIALSVNPITCNKYYSSDILYR